MLLPLRAVIIEDSDDDLLIVVRELRRGGFELEYLQVQTTDELQSALDNEHWDIILSDYSLPRFSAPAALKILKRCGKDIPFIVISGAVGEEIAVQLIQHGARDYINKDNLSRLCSTIQRELEEARSKREISQYKALTERLIDMLDHSLNEFYVFDAQSLKFKFVNQGALKNLGYNLAEIESMHAYDIKPQISKNEFEQMLQPLLDGSIEHLQFETTHIRKNGSTYPVEVRLQLSRSQECNFYFAIILDISERVKTNATIESLAKFPEENPSPVLRLSPNGDIQYANPACQYITAHWCTVYKEDTPQHWRTLIKQCLNDKKLVEFEEQVNTKIFSWLFSPSADYSYVNCYAHDITQQRLAENEQRQAALVFNNSIEGIIITDSNNKIIQVNPAFSQITGYSQDEVIGKDPKFLKSGRHSEHFYSAMWYKIDNHGSWQGEIWNKRKDGEIYPEYMTVSVLKDDENNIKNYIGVFADISERVEAEKHIHRLAYYDPVTELPNRFNVKEILARITTRAKAENKQIAIVYLNINRFKTINESLGHIAADETLKLLAKRLQVALSDNYELGRMGGDEFLILLKTNYALHEDSQEITHILETIEKPIRINEQDIYLTASMGVSHYPNDAENVETLIKYAESALNNAKSNGESVKIFNEDLFVRGIEHISFESELRQALEKDEFVLHYQPQVDLVTRDIIGVEALLRWKHPDKGLIPPSDFIPLLEETGLILPVGNWVIRSACKQIQYWKENGIETRVAINLSPKQFNQRDFFANIEKILKETAINPGMLEFEVTESIIMNRNNHVIALLNDFHKCNIKLSIDDFGTGYSSLSYLKHFPIDVLKIDRSFVMELQNNKDDIAIVNTIISMGHNLNMKVIAEGVETAEQAAILKELGCEFAQGFYFSRPVPVEECTKYIIETNNH